MPSGARDDEAALSTLHRPSGVSARLGEYLVRPWIYWLFHSTRLFGYFFTGPPIVYLWPKQSLSALGAYMLIHRQSWWQKSVHRFLGYGASRQHRFVNEQQHLLDKDKRYLWALHPHGVLADGWHSLIANQLDAFDDTGNGPYSVGRKISLCFAPIIQHVPVHQEMYRDKCGGADKPSIVKWWETPDTDPALIPGGFAESIFANAAERNTEYSYLKDRKGFVRICLEEGKDIVPIYTFRVNWMYHNPAILRGWRARFSQHYYIGLVFLFGKLGTSMPLTDKTTTVVFPPCEIGSKYSVDQLDEAHAAYLQHLKKHFDLYKAQYGMKGVNMEFIGNDFVDEDVLSKTLLSLGLIKGPTQPKLAKQVMQKEPEIRSAL
jgi:hypothetical protein